jgi:hypothetical protein
MQVGNLQETQNYVGLLGKYQFAKLRFIYIIIYLSFVVLPKERKHGIIREILNRVILHSIGLLRDYM